MEWGPATYRTMADATAVFFTPTPVATIMAKPLAFTDRREPAMLQFVKDHGMNKSVTQTTDADGNATCSHYMYGGLFAMGKLTVPQGRPTEGLASAIVVDFKMGRFGALTENKPAGKPSRFYIDYDIELASKPTEKFWNELERVQMEEIRKFFPASEEELAAGTALLTEAKKMPPGSARDEAERIALLSGADGYVPADDPLFDAIVLAAGVRDCELDDGTSGYKAGIHVVWQNLFVNIDMALYLSSAIIAKAEKTWPEKDGVWTKRIDQGVYGKTRGLRWAWQFKAETCSDCCRKGENGKRIINRKGCDLCFHGVRADVMSSMYAPVYYVNGKAERRVIPACRDAPTVELMLDSSIRYIAQEEPSDGFVVYPGAAPKPQLKMKTKKTNYVAVAQSDEGDMRKASAGRNEVLDFADGRMTALRRCIRRVDAMYKDLDIRSAIRSPTGKWYKVFVKNSGSGYCMNIGRDHRGAKIKFLITRKGVQQMCFCSCDTKEGRLSGQMCRDYKSAPHPLLGKEQAELFETTGDDVFSSIAAAMVGNTRGAPTIDDATAMCQAQVQKMVKQTPVPITASAFSHEHRQKVRTSKFTKRMMAVAPTFGDSSGPKRKFHFILPPVQSDQAEAPPVQPIHRVRQTVDTGF